VVLSWVSTVEMISLGLEILPQILASLYPCQISAIDSTRKVPQVTSYFKPFVTPTGRRRGGNPGKCGGVSSRSVYVASVRIKHSYEKNNGHHKIPVPSPGPGLASAFDCCT